MCNKYISAAAFLAMMILLGGVRPAEAQKKDDLYKAADAAAAAGRIEESQKAYCQVAKMDGRYKDAKMLCAVMTEELERENKKNEERYIQGIKQFKEGKYDGAQHEFANIRWGTHVEEAQLYLKVKIPQARQGAREQDKKR